MFLIAAIPALGYAAYLIPLRRQNETAAFVFANHISYALFDATTEGLIARSPRPLRRVARQRGLPRGTPTIPSTPVTSATSTATS